jgi:outer membrane protein assembly factor BamB
VNGKMAKKRVSIWIVAAIGVLCMLLTGFILLVSATFIPGLYLVHSELISEDRDIEYPPEVLDGNEDLLANLNVIGLPLSPIWEYQSPGPIDRPPQYKADHLILKGGKFLRSVDARSGHEEWHYESTRRIYAPYSDEIVVTAEAVAFQTYLWPSTLQVIDLETGLYRWETQSIVRGVGSDDEGRLFIGAPGGYQALDAASGQTAWVSDIRPIRGGSAILYDPSFDELYVVDDTGTHVVLDSETGELRRRLRGELSGGDAPVVVTSGALYVTGGRPESLSAVDGRRNSLLWTKSYPSPSHMFKPVVHENVLYIRTLQGALLVVNRHSGDIQWEYPFHSDSTARLELLSNPIVLDGVVYGIFSDARLRGFDATSGQEIGHVQFVDVANDPLTQRTVPGLASSDHMLFVSLGKTKLYAFEVTP